MKISIITATWNSGATLRYTMRSVLSQSYPNIEHIIVDGGSTDSTMEIVHELEPEYQGKLRYISGKDKGIYDAMNKGDRNGDRRYCRNTLIVMIFIPAILCFQQWHPHLKTVT